MVARNDDLVGEVEPCEYFNELSKMIPFVIPSEITSMNKNVALQTTIHCFLQLSQIPMCVRYRCDFDLPHITLHCYTF